MKLIRTVNINTVGKLLKLRWLRRDFSSSFFQFLERMYNCVFYIQRFLHSSQNPTQQPGETRKQHMTKNLYLYSTHRERSCTIKPFSRETRRGLSASKWHPTHLYQEENFITWAFICHLNYFACRVTMLCHSLILVFKEIWTTRYRTV